MSAIWLWVRADLRRRWRSWVVLGLLAGISFGLACAGIAGARRTDRAIPDYAARSHVPDVAVLANDPEYDAAKRDEVANLPEVKATYPFVVPFVLTVTKPKGLEGSLVPATRASMGPLSGVVLEGRLPDADRADEVVVNEVVRDTFDLDIGSTITVAQQPPGASDPIPAGFVPPGDKRIKQQLRVVGILDASDEAQNLMVSSGFYAKYRDGLIGPVNQFVDLRRGPADYEKFRADVQKVVGHPVNVPTAAELFGVEKLRRVSDVEEGGLLLFALAVLIGAGALVGQALVRSVTAGAADLPTWRALGAGRRVVVRGLVLPAFLTAAVGAVTAVVVAIALSPRFPIALTRNFDLDLGYHADWAVLALGVAVLVTGVLVTAWITAEIRIRRTVRVRSRTSTTARFATTAGLPPSLMIGSRLAVEPGQGRRAVPVRSALVGAIVGVLGVVACLTFRAGLSDTVADPARSGIVWDSFVAGEGQVSPADIATITKDDAVAAVLHAEWARAVRINGTATPTWGTQSVKGRVDLVVISGRAPRANDELALAPTTMHQLGLHVGDTVRAGNGAGRRMRVVGTALLPPSSHTPYDESAWMSLSALQRVMPPGDRAAAVEDYLLLRLRPGADGAAVQKRMSALGQGSYFVGAAELPTDVISLGQLRALPFALAVFFALLAVATVAHAIVTTVRRRRVDLAVLRSIGFTRRDARIAIAWQATLIAIVGLVVGIPLGIVTGRLLWKQLAESFPVAYVPPLALVAVLVVVPAAIVIANLVAAGPAHAATRIRPARVLRAE